MTAGRGFCHPEIDGQPSDRLERPGLLPGSPGFFWPRRDVEIPAQAQVEAWDAGERRGPFRQVTAATSY
jgi:hypothetical protein